MAKNEAEGLVILLDVGVSMSTKIDNTTTYLQSSIDIIQMLVQRKMFQSSKDEIGLVLFGTRETDNCLWDGSSDKYSHITLAQVLCMADWRLMELIQNDINYSNLEGDILDGLLVAGNHFSEDINMKKIFRQRRILVLTDFSASTDDDDQIEKIIKRLLKEDIRVDVISPFSDDDADSGNDHKHKNNDTASNSTEEKKTMTKSQKQCYELLKSICDKTEGSTYSFTEALNILSVFQAKSVRTTGTKFTMQIGDSFKMPIVSMIKCKESKPDLFKFKKVYAKEESVELKVDRARFTKDDEQRDLDDKTDVVDAYRYGSTYVPIDDPTSLKLQVEKSFTVLGYTRSDLVRRCYYLGDSINQIVPDAIAGEDVERGFVNMVHSMYIEDVYAIVRKVYSRASSPELGCLIPHISKGLVCLFYVSLPFEDDVRKYQLENFNFMKKFTPNKEQMDVVDELIDSMDLSRKNDEDEEEEFYNPHLTFNQFNQRMFQSITFRATNPDSGLPDFENHFTNNSMKDQEKAVMNKKTLNLLKRCADAFPTKEIISSKKKKADENIFAKKSDKQENDAENEEAKDENSDNFLLDIVSNSDAKKVKKVGTVSPVEDFKHLAENIVSSEENKEDDFEEICLQIQAKCKEFFEEALLQISSSDQDDSSINSFYQKVIDCIRVQREYSIKLKSVDIFNSYLRGFKVYIKNEIKKATSNRKLFQDNIESFWNDFFVSNNLSLIHKQECASSDIDQAESKEFLESFLDNNQKLDESNHNDSKINENEEDLLDLM